MAFAEHILVFMLYVPWVTQGHLLKIKPDQVKFFCFKACHDSPPPREVISQMGCEYLRKQTK